MNPHDDIPADDAQDEKQLASMLGAADSDAAPPDPELLAKLRAQSTEAFAASSARPVPIKRWRPARWLAAAAVIAIVGMGLYFWLSPGPSGVALGQVLDNTEKADTLHARFRLGEQEIEFWHTSTPNRSRWQERDGRYRIGDGGKSRAADGR